MLTYGFRDMLADRRTTRS